MWLLNCGNVVKNKRHCQHWAGKENDGNKHENNSVEIDVLGFKKSYLYLELDFFIDSGISFCYRKHKSEGTLYSFTITQTTEMFTIRSIYFL
jgi:hypothetical protein